MVMALSAGFIACSSGDNGSDGTIDVPTIDDTPTTPSLVGTWRATDEDSPFSVLFFDGKGNMKSNDSKMPNDFEDGTYTFDEETGSLTMTYPDGSLYYQEELTVLKLTEKNLTVYYADNYGAYKIEFLKVSSSAVFDDKMFDEEFSTMLVGKWSTNYSEYRTYYKYEVTFSKGGTVVIDDYISNDDSYSDATLLGSYKGTWELSHGTLTISAGQSMLNGSFHIMTLNEKEGVLKKDNPDNPYDYYSLDRIL